MTSYPRILILAPIPYPGRPLGGVVVLVQNFLDFLRTGQYPFIHISTNHYAGRFAGPGNLLCLLIGLLVNIRRCDIVMFNCSSRSAFAMYPFFTFLALFFRKKVVFRMFAGAFYEVYTRQPKFLRRCFVKALRRSTLIFGEIAATTHYLRKLSGKENVHQFPNVRIPIPEEPIAQ